MMRCSLNLVTVKLKVGIFIVIFIVASSSSSSSSSSSAVTVAVAMTAVDNDDDDICNRYFNHVLSSLRPTSKDECIQLIQRLELMNTNSKQQQQQQQQQQSLLIHYDNMSINSLGYAISSSPPYHDDDTIILIKWTTYLNIDSLLLEPSEELSNLIHGGIPHTLRRDLWPRLCQAAFKKHYSSLSYSSSLAASHHSISALCKSQIENDLARSMPSNVFYASITSNGICRLRNILQTLACRYSSIGYCQGFGMIVCSLLLLLEEVDAYWMMVVLIEDIMPHNYYSLTLLGAQVDQLVLRDLVNECFPRLSAILGDCGVELSIVTRNWFLTAFAGCLPPYVQLRVWDTFFYTGSIQLFRVTLALLMDSYTELLEQRTEGDLLTLLASLPSRVPDTEDAASALINSACSNPVFSVVTPDYLGRKRERYTKTLLDELNDDKDMASLSLKDTLLPYGDRNYLRKPFMWFFLTEKWFNSSVSRFFSSSEYDDSKIGSSMKLQVDEHKNVLQSKILLDLNEAIFDIVAHFNYNIQCSSVPEGCICKELHENSLDSAETISTPLVPTLCQCMLRRAKVLWPFKANTEDELSIEANDIITLLHTYDEHCWYGKLKSKQGWFPAHFVQPLDERSKRYSSVGDDKTNPLIALLVHDQLGTAFRRVLFHGFIDESILLKPYHVWHFIEESAMSAIKDAGSRSFSNVKVYRSFSLDHDRTLLAPVELLYRSVERINVSHCNLNIANTTALYDSKLRSFIAHALNEQMLDRWFSILYSQAKIVSKWYRRFSFLCNPVRIQISDSFFNLRHLSFSLDTRPATSLYGIDASSNMTINGEIQELLVKSRVKYHLYSYDLD